MLNGRPLWYNLVLEPQVESQQRWGLSNVATPGQPGIILGFSLN